MTPATHAFLADIQWSRARYLVAQGWTLDAAAAEACEYAATFRGGVSGGDVL